MTTRRALIKIFMASVFVLFSSFAFAGIGDFLKGVQKSLSGGELSESRIVQGLKEALDAKVSSLPFTEALRFDLDQYVTDRGLNGLFLMLAEEERKIRQDPAARVTELLKEVFGRK